MVASVDLQGLLKKLPEKVGFWNRGSHKNLRKLVAKMEEALTNSGELTNDFIKRHYITIKKFSLQQHIEGNHEAGCSSLS